MTIQMTNCYGRSFVQCRSECICIYYAVVLIDCIVTEPYLLPVLLLPMYDNETLVGSLEAFGLFQHRYAEISMLSAQVSRFVVSIITALMPSAFVAAVTLVELQHIQGEQLVLIHWRGD